MYYSMHLRWKNQEYFTPLIINSMSFLCKEHWPFSCNLMIISEICPHFRILHDALTLSLNFRNACCLKVVLYFGNCMMSVPSFRYCCLDSYILWSLSGEMAENSHSEELFHRQYGWSMFCLPVVRLYIFMRLERFTITVSKSATYFSYPICYNRRRHPWYCGS